MALMEKVCCCIPLHHGNVVLGIIDIILYLTSLAWLWLIQEEFILTTAWAYISVYVTIIVGIHLMLCIFLTCGTMAKANGLILPWLIGQLVVIIISIVGPIILMAMGVIKSIGFAVVIMVIWNLYQIYHLVCAHSFYKTNGQRLEYESLD